VPQGKRKVDISVVVPSYNGAGTIRICLESVERAVRGRRAEIIVVDSSTDATPAIVREDFPAVTLIRSDERLSAGAARNRGSAAARGRLIFFTDQDCVVPHDWIDRMAAHLADPAVSGVGGSIGIRNISSASGNALYFLEFLNQFPGRGRVRADHPFLIGCNSAYRRTVLQAARFPDQTLGEDVLFGHELRKRGLRTLYDPRIEVLHENREGWRAFFRYNRRIGEAAAAYHAVLGLGWAAPFLRYPTLAFAAPAAVLPCIALHLLRSRPGYLLRFVALLPMCLLGNLAWATGFRRQARLLRAQRAPRAPRPAASRFARSRNGSGNLQHTEPRPDASHGPGRPQDTRRVADPEEPLVILL
jgi:GT2 family glycosyltransferase